MVNRARDMSVYHPIADIRTDIALTFCAIGRHRPVLFDDFVGGAEQPR
jgi:hypothetical protein